MRQSYSMTPLRLRPADVGGGSGAGLGFIPIAALVLVVVALSGLKSCVRARHEAVGVHERELPPMTVVAAEATRP